MRDRIDQIGERKTVDFEAIERETLNAARLDLDHQKRLDIYRLCYLVYSFAHKPEESAQAHALTLLQDNVDDVDPWLLE